MIPSSWFCDVCNGVGDGNTSCAGRLNHAGRACKCRPVARRPGAQSKCPPVCAGMFYLKKPCLSQSTMTVCQNSGGPELGYCLCQSSHSVIHHSLREQMKENNVTWCQRPRSSRKLRVMHYKFSLNTLTWKTAGLFADINSKCVVVAKEWLQHSKEKDARPQIEF